MAFSYLYIAIVVDDPEHCLLKRNPKHTVRLNTSGSYIAGLGPVGIAKVKKGLHLLGTYRA
jgi:hypothetical protein